MKELYLKLYTAYENYRGTGRLLAVFLVAVLAIYFIEKKDENGRRLNPAVFLLSVWSGIAYAASYVAAFLFQDREKKKLSGMGVLALLLCMLALSLTGTRILNQSYFEKADNTLHIKEEYVQVCEQLLTMEENPKVIAPPGFAPYLKMYSSRFDTLYDYPKNGDVSLLSDDARTVYEQLSGAHPDMKLVADVAKRNDCRYVLLETGKFYPQFPITEYGYTLYMTCGNWEIYREMEGDGL